MLQAAVSARAIKSKGAANMSKINSYNACIYARLSRDDGDKLDGMPRVPGQDADTTKARPCPKARPYQNDVVPVVQARHTAYGEILTLFGCSVSVDAPSGNVKRYKT